MKLFEFKLLIAIFFKLNWLDEMINDVEPVNVASFSPFKVKS